MSLTLFSHGDLNGGRADQIALALCGDDLNRVFAIVAAGAHIHCYMWDLDGEGFAPVIDKDLGGGTSLAATFAADDRILAAFKHQTQWGFHCFDDSLNSNPQWDELEVSPAYNSVALAGIPHTDHLLSTGGAVALKKRITQQTDTGTTTGTTRPHAPLTLKPKTGITISVGPRIAYAAMAAVTQDHKLLVSVWRMDWHGHVKTKLGQAVLGMTDPILVADVAVVNATWDDDFLKRTEFVTAVRTGAPENRLKLMRWRRDSDGIALVSVKLADDQVQAVAIAPLEAGANSWAVTAVIGADGNLKVIAWKLALDGTITRGAEASGEAVTMVKIAWVRDRDVVTVVKVTAGGSLRIIYWRFPEAGGAAIRLGESTNQQIGFALDVAHIPGTGNSLGETIIATNVDGDLKLLRFGVTEN